MRQCVIWLILLQLCSSENVDYSDYHPMNFPLQNSLNVQSEHQAPEYNEFVKTLCDDWQSPISYLKKRGYMPATDNENSDSGVHIKKHEEYRDDSSNDENYNIILPDDENQSLKKNCIALIGFDQPEEKAESSKDESEPPVSDSKSDMTGIINKVRDKFLSIFSSHSANPCDENNKNEKCDFADWEYDQNGLDLFNGYDVPERRLHARSTNNKPAKLRDTAEEDLLKNLTETEVMYIKNFIKCFKDNKKVFEIQEAKTSSASNDEKSESEDCLPSNNTVSSTEWPKTSSTDSCDDSQTIPTKTSSTTDNCIDIQTTPKTIVQNSTICNDDSISNKTLFPTNTTSKTLGLGIKGDADDITVDLDINQKNGSGQETRSVENGSCVQTPSHTTPLPLNPNQNHPCANESIYTTKSKFLAHLHHMVDEVGKPPRKPIDLNEVQNIIDKSKSTVITGDTKTTECAPLRLNDMSFDLEWNKMNKPLDVGRDKMGVLDNPFLKKRQGQSLAAKFLHDVHSYSNKNEQYLRTPYGENFLDSQQTFPEESDQPLKLLFQKREIPFKSSSHRRKTTKPLSETAVLPDTEIDEDYNYEGSEQDTSKRRTRLRAKNRSRKKLKHKHKASQKRREPDPDSVEDEEDDDKNNNYKSFDELNDIQFRVNSDDEEAISKFITNLNSPPEVFSFDVDKYLRSAEEENEPQISAIQSPEPRTYYEFLDAPAVENAKLPLIENPNPADDEEPIVEKRYRIAEKKRDLLRQYIKGVSNALIHNPENRAQFAKTDEENKSQRSSFANSDVPIDAYVPEVDFNSNYAKPNPGDGFPDNYYLLNDGSVQIYDLSKEDPEVLNSRKYSAKGLDIDIELDKKFRELGLGTFHEGDKKRQVASHAEGKVNDLMMTEIGRNVDKKDYQLRDQD